MTIDTKRLATDAAYWDEVAPSWATHHKLESKKSIASWWHVPDGCELPSEGLIPRPQAPEAEWVDGLPPEGEFCEAYDHTEGIWVSGKLLMHGNRDHAFASGSPERWNKLFWACKFRPIRTKEQRLRDELAELIGEHQELSGSFVTPENTADAILSRYNLEPKT